MISIPAPEMPISPVVREDDLHIVIVARNGDRLALKKPISERWDILLSQEGKTTGIQLKQNLCSGCSFQHYDEEGGTYCGSFEDVCPRGGGRF